MLELVIDGAQRIDQRRNAALDALERSGGPRSIADVARRLFETSIEADDDAAPAPEQGVTTDGYQQFIASLQVQHRKLFLDALENRWNAG